ncbi:M16 family metallopeptidase [Haliangium sp.]|uniref:M16 family metallopeptidase n=1 Tax=Haliangium sp. TaxID=2663208 RepID=UPI003D11AC8D
MRFPQNVHMFHTKNGLELLVMPDLDTNLVKVDLRYRVGAAEDPMGKAGLAHLVEHMSYELRLGDGGDGGPTLTSFLAERAVYHNAYTTWDETHYTAIGFREDLLPLLTVEARRMSAGCDDIEPALLERERDVVQSELRQRDGSGKRGYDFLRGEVYGRGHAYQRSIGGSAAEVASITAEDVCGFVAGHYAPNRAILVVSGNVDPNLVAGHVGKLFGHMGKRADMPQRTVGPARLDGTSSRHTLDVDEATALIALPGSAFGTKEAVYQRLLVELIRGRVVGLLEENEYMTHVAADVGGGMRAPLLLVSISVKDPARLKAAVGAFFDEVAELGDKPLGTPEFIALRERSRASLVRTIEPFMHEAMMYTDYAQYTDHDRFVLEELGFYEALSAAGLMQQAQRTVRRSASHIAYLVPDPEAETTETRAALSLPPKDYELEDWHLPIDPSQADQSPEVPPRHPHALVRSYTLPNGLRVLLVPSLDYPVVDIRLMFRAGSLHDPPDKPGLARLAMNLLRPNRPQVQSLQDLVAVEQMKVIYMMGGDMERYMDERTTTFRMTGMSAYADGLLWWLHWTIENGIYERDDMKRMSELLARDDDDDDQVHAERVRTVLRSLYGGEHPYARGGELERTLASVGPSELRDFRDRHYRMDGATLMVTGGFDAGVIRAEIERLFSWGERGPAPPLPKVPPAAVRATTQHLAVFDEGARQTGVLIAFDTQPGLVQHQAARLVLREMIDETVSSLRERLGATYGVSVRQASREGPGLLLIGASLDHERAVEAFEALLAALDQLRRGDITATFVRARRRALRKILADSFHSKSVADELELLMTYELPAMYYDTLAQRIADLRLSDLRALMARELAPQHQVVLVYGPRATLDTMFQAAGITGVQILE